MFRFPGFFVLFLVAGFILSGGPASAQLKVAVVNAQKALLETAEIKKAQADLETKYKPRQEEMAKLQKELEDIQRQLQTLGDKLTQQAQADLNVQGQRKQRELQRLGEDMQQDVDYERNGIIARASQQMQDVVTKLAEAKGLDIVVGAGSILYAKPVLDLTAEATQAYDKAHPLK